MKIRAVGAALTGKALVHVFASVFNIYPYSCTEAQSLISGTDMRKVMRWIIKIESPDYPYSRGPHVEFTRSTLYERDMGGAYMCDVRVVVKMLRYLPD
jgi:hypothetical protein